MLIRIGSLCAVLAFLSFGSPTHAEDAPPFIKEFGGFGTDPGKFFNPLSIKFDTQDQAYILDSLNGRVQKFTSDGDFVWATESGLFPAAYTLGIDTQNNIHVADFFNNRIMTLSTDGAVTDSLSLAYPPLSIAFDSQNNLYVTDPVDSLINKYDQTGGFLLSWKSQNANSNVANFLYGIAVNSQGHVFVTDLFSARVEEYTGAGQFINAWGVSGSAPGQLYQPWGLAFENDDRLYIADCGNNRVQAFTADGTFIVAFGSLGTTPTLFGGPTDVGFDNNKNIYVVDAGNHRIQKFGPHPNPVTLSSLSGSREGTRVVLQWEVNSLFEKDVAFRVYRDNTEVTAVPLTGKRRYEFVDANAPRGVLTYWLQEENALGDTYRHGPITIGAAEPLVLDMRVHPNPFNPVATISYIVPEVAPVQLQVYDVSGALVATLIDNKMTPAGSHAIEFAHPGASGVYFARLTVGKKSRTVKMVEMK